MVLCVYVVCNVVCSCLMKVGKLVMWLMFSGSVIVWWFSVLILVIRVCVVLVWFW